MTRNIRDYRTVEMSCAPSSSVRISDLYATILGCHKNILKTDTVAGTGSPSYFGGWSRRTAKVQEFKNGLNNTARAKNSLFSITVNWAWVTAKTECICSCGQNINNILLELNWYCRFKYSGGEMEILTHRLIYSVFPFLK